jgi:hypothetical protein
MSTITKNQKRRARLLNRKLTNDEFESIIEENKKLNTPDTPRSYTGDSTTSDMSDVQDVKTETPKPVTESSSEILTIDEIVTKIDGLWKVVKKYAADDPSFKELPDKEKLELFRNKYGYGKLMEEYPIITRYIICMGQYKSKALRRVLEKTRTMKHPPNEKREKGYMEDQWVRRQADYVTYMWEEYQKSHYNIAERNWVWQQTYEKLKGEFDDFRQMHKEVENKIAEEKRIFAGRNVRDLLERLKTGKQKLSPEDELYLLEHLKGVIMKAKFKEVMKQLTATRPQIKPTAVGMGEGTNREQQKITMIETVDANRMGEIDDKYKPEELRGMEPVPEDMRLSSIIEETDELISEEIVD